MAKKSFTRRQFLTYSALGASAYTASGCTSLNQFFMGDSRILKEEVIIFGAGASGLAAAHELKKNKVPFRIFEASSRIGGRVHTVQVQSEKQYFSEMGAEFFQDYHQTTRKLIEELSLTEREVSIPAGLESQLFLIDSKVLRSRDMQNGLRNAKSLMRKVRSDLYRNHDVQLTRQNSGQFERSNYFDNLSLQQLLKTWEGQIDSRLLKLIEIQAVNRFGVPANQQSSLMFLSTLNLEGSTLLQGSKSYRLDGGLSQLTMALAERISGVIPGRVLKLEHQLVEVSEKAGQFRVVFKTPNGREEYRTQRVICTLPLPALKQVKGFSDLSWQAPVAEFVSEAAYAQHEKGHLLFPSNFWRKAQGNTPASVGNVTGEFKSQKIWHAGRAQDKAESPLLTYQRVSSGADDFCTAAQVQADLKKIYKDTPSPVGGSFQNVLWSQRLFSKGSMLAYAPGQFAKYNGLLAEGFYQGAWQFAGEHVSDVHFGTLEGAIQTGITAARAYIASPVTS